MPKPLEPSPVLARIKMAVDLGMPYQMIISIPYHDLLGLIIEEQIKRVLINHKNVETERLNRLGIERTSATKDDFESFFN